MNTRSKVFSTLVVTYYPEVVESFNNKEAKEQEQ
jgi:hypothetical protein